MTRSDKDVLFLPIQIGPVTARNRFYQTSHGNGNGYRNFDSMVNMRATKAAGGWAVVATEQTEIHPTSDMAPLVELRSWDEKVASRLNELTAAVHAHGSLAALELSHSGYDSGNFRTGLTPIGPSSLPVHSSSSPLPEHIYARRMEDSDIAAFKEWHRIAVRQGLDAGFDIIYVYASDYFSLLGQFLARNNQREDQYGGSLENRSRLLREVLEDTIQIVKGRAAVAVRMTLDQFVVDQGTDADLRAFFGSLGELPDLWDLVVGGMGKEPGSSRFDRSSFSVDVFRKVKSLTTKPVVGVGFIGNAVQMAELVRSGVVDMIGAARASIADPFLPKKILEGKEDDIIRCIKCNICVATELLSSPIRCTQNPSFGEEWSRGWFPNQFNQVKTSTKLAILGAGPAGLEAACVLGQRGYEVDLYERTSRAGGRALRESMLPGLDTYSYIYEDRLRIIGTLPNVTLRFEDEGGRLFDRENDEYEAVALAVGARWSRTGLSRDGETIPVIENARSVLTPDDVLDGRIPTGNVLVYDDDHYYMGACISELLVVRGCTVTLVTPLAEVSMWAHRTMEQYFVQQRLLKLGVNIIPHHQISEIREDAVKIASVFTGGVREVETDSVVLATVMVPSMAAWKNQPRWTDEDRSAKRVLKIGDCLTPGIIAYAIRSAHSFAREYPSHSPYGTVGRNTV